MPSRKRQNLCFILTVNQDGSAIFEAQAEDSYADELFQKWVRKGYLESTSEFGNLSAGNQIRYKTTEQFRYTVATFRRAKSTQKATVGNEETPSSQLETGKNFQVDTPSNQTAWEFFAGNAD